MSLFHTAAKRIDKATTMRRWFLSALDALARDPKLDFLQFFRHFDYPPLSVPITFLQIKSWAPQKPCATIPDGELAEWSIAAVLKTVEPKGSRGSNPLLSARYFLAFERIFESSSMFFLVRLAGIFEP